MTSTTQTSTLDSTPLDVLAYLRSINLIGEGNLFGGPDELLLHSGGPESDLARSSLLMGPPTMRFLVRQPSRTELPALSANHSPLSGEIKIQHQLASMKIDVEVWNNGWYLETQHTGNGLADGLRACESYLSSTNRSEFSPGGFAGLLTYDMVQFTEPLRFRHPPEEDEILMVLYRADRWIIHNRQRDVLEAHSTIEDDSWLTAVETIISNPIPTRDLFQSPKSVMPSSESDSEHMDKIRRTQVAIREGVLYQLNYGRKWKGRIESPWRVFEQLAQDNPAPCAAWLSAPDLDLAIMSSSPELLLRQEGESVSTRPIKGTRPRGDDAEHDANLRGELVGSQKEIAEHLMLVDLERNDLGRICAPGSVRWNRWRIESYPHVQHMVSEIEGQLRHDCDGFDALQSLFPGGSITGCPKSATIAAIDELESTPRRVWTGSIGHIDPRTSISEWNILIRTIDTRFESGHWEATIQAGGGLVIGSDPIQEVEEAKWKAHALCQAAWNYAPITTSIHSPRGLNAVSLHPIPPITNTVRQLIESRDVGLIQQSIPDAPAPVKWAPGLRLNRLDTGPRILFVDNLDSFSWNIVHAFATLGAEVIVIPGRGGPIDSEHLIESLHPTHIVLGPGPGRPEQSQLTMNLAKLAFSGNAPPLLGICLGHQAIGLTAGWPLIPSPLGAVHGVPESITSRDETLMMTRYHSLILYPDESTVANSELEIIARDATTESLIMAVKHQSIPIFGYQFHPESSGSVDGVSILADFLAC
ncbi:MAG: chorismate-binding protein [Candidatus Thermoplasmatota archaeon]|nr:chorismate-binding protein [Candidatus Thermoplasmatota archaeon]